MKLDLDLLKNHLNWFADGCDLTIKKIGDLADECSSVDDFKIKLDELCPNGTTSLEVLAGFGVKLPDTKTTSTPLPSENSALQNELVEVKEKIDKLNERNKSQQAEARAIQD